MRKVVGDGLRLDAAVQLLLRKFDDVGAGYRVTMLVRDIKRLDALQNLGFGPTDLFVAFLGVGRFGDTAVFPPKPACIGRISRTDGRIRETK